MAKLLWTQKQDIGPSPRFGHAMAFDAARGRVVLFGGGAFGDDRFGDTWTWDGEHWTQVENIGPAARAGHAMAYDSGRQRVVLFGGRAVGGLLDDTWEWDGESWTQVQDSGPSPRDAHAMAFDAARGRVVLFGGAAGDPFGDTWAWDGSDWAQQDNVGPSPRQGHAMAYDTVRERVVLFGGAGASTPDGIADTWEWDGTAWTQVADMGPDGCLAGALVFRSTRAALFGGVSTRAAVPARRLFGLTWEWDGAHWTARQDIGVGARVGHAMAYDTTRGRVVLFGGLQGFVDDEEMSQLRGDTWEHPDTAGGSGTGGGDVAIAAVDGQPNPVHANEDFTITVTLASPALPGGQAVSLESNLGSLGDIAVAAGESAGQVSFTMPPDIGAMVPLPFSFEITAISGSSSATTTVMIE